MARASTNALSGVNIENGFGAKYSSEQFTKVRFRKTAKIIVYINFLFEVFIFMFLLIINLD